MVTDAFHNKHSAAIQTVVHFYLHFRRYCSELLTWTIQNISETN